MQVEGTFTLAERNWRGISHSVAEESRSRLCWEKWLVRCYEGDLKLFSLTYLHNVLRFFILHMLLVFTTGLHGLINCDSRM